MTWLESVLTALRNLGGAAHITEIYEEVGKVRDKQLSYNDRAAVRKFIYLHSSSSEAFLHGKNHFLQVGSKRSGFWRLQTISPAPKANDFESVRKIKGNETPGRIIVEVNRIVRDTLVSRSLKGLHKNCCQRCGMTLTVGNGRSYAEAHHLQPLGRPHNGPDVPENVIVVCPNCHALLDFFAVEICAKELRGHKDHKIARKYLNYHNRKFRMKSPLSSK
jgi:predicted restriction endonuclease